MTIEEKAKAYDEALEKAKDCLKDGTITSTAIDYISTIFPELKESEDEVFRKYILKCCEETIQMNNRGLELSMATTKQLKNWLEKQCEQKTAVIDFKAKNWYVSKVDGKIHDMTYNSTDKVEPKFKVGDWVVTSYGKVNQVIAIDEDGDGFTLDDDTYFSGSWKDSYHLWTIQDAKDGDVLISQSGNPLIYNGNYNSLNIGAYCGITCDDNKFEVAEEKCHWTENVDIKPATKEQRDTLMKAMADAGYTFDFEKKELKKIEQKPACSEEDETVLNNLIYALANDRIRNDRDEYISWLKSLKERVQPQNNSITDEELEQAKKDAYNDALDKIEYHSGEPTFADGWHAAIDCIKKKSFKPNLQWKPSKEQMHAFIQVYVWYNNNFAPSETLTSLYNDLKKL